MRPDRNLPVHGIIYERLTRGVGQVVVTPDHMGHALVVIIYNHRQHVGWATIGP